MPACGGRRSSFSAFFSYLEGISAFDKEIILITSGLCLVEKGKGRFAGVRRKRGDVEKGKALFSLVVTTTRST